RGSRTGRRPRQRPRRAACRRVPHGARGRHRPLARRGRDGGSVNLVILTGRLGRDPESRTTQSGTTVCTLSVATDEREKDRDGNWVKRPEWHRVVCFGKVAENVA